MERANTIERVARRAKKLLHAERAGLSAESAESTRKSADLQHQRERAIFQACVASLETDGREGLERAKENMERAKEDGDRAKEDMDRVLQECRSAEQYFLRGHQEELRERDEQLWDLEQERWIFREGQRRVEEVADLGDLGHGEGGSSSSSARPPASGRDGGSMGGKLGRMIMRTFIVLQEHVVLTVT